VRVGALVMFNVDMTVTSISSPPASQVRIAGFPFTRSGASGAYTPYIENVNVPGTLNLPLADWATGTELRLVALNNNAGPSSITYANLGANARIKVAGVCTT